MRIAFGAVACLVVSLGCAAEPAEKLQLSEDDLKLIVTVAQATVKAQLAAPTTATLDTDTPPTVDVSYFKRRNITSIAVMGKVDASNYFGAVLRKWYIVQWDMPGRFDKLDAQGLTESISKARVHFF